MSSRTPRPDCAGKGTDESWGLYEDMEAPIFYNPTNPSENVTLCAATCETKNRLAVR